MKIPKQAQKQANALFQACRVNGVLDFQRALEAVELLLKEQPRGWSPILQHLKNRIRLESARRTVTVQSATALDTTQREQITQALRAKSPSLPLEFNFSVNPELLGGLRVQIGWSVLDATVRTRLENILE